MDSNEVRSRFLKFFEKRGHKIIPSSSLIPENDPSVLFTTAGMQQFKQYYTAPENALKDFGTKNVVTIQKCVRTSDIDEVGDDTHNTFIEMLGNFSFGGYGKHDAINYANKFITEELNLKISYVTVFRGTTSLLGDGESIQIWKELGIPSEKIIEQDMEDVFWGPTGDEGPCGPTTEIYCKNANGEDVEIWNIVFNQYFCKGSREALDKGVTVLSDLPILGIDTGMGFERLLSIIQNKKSNYETDLFEPTIEEIKKHLIGIDLKSQRIISDHVRTSLFLLADGVEPSNKDRGYILRRLLRRAISYTYKADKNFDSKKFELIAKVIAKIYKNYPELDSEVVYTKLKDEARKFRKTIEEGIKEIEKNPLGKLSAEFFFNLHQTYGFPFELSLEEVNKRRKKNGLLAVPQDVSNHFQELFEKHQKLSQTSSSGMFKGGLANHNEKTVKLHTAHHLLLAALKAIVSKNVKQRGSNITEERLRLDFLCDHKLTEEEKEKIEIWVNDKIKQGLNIIRREMALPEAEKFGAEMEFGTKYPDIVSVYLIEDQDGNAISKEFCGGPHVSNTKELSTFKILKEEAVSSGVRRIKAVLL